MAIISSTDVQTLADLAEGFSLKDDCIILRDTEGTLDAMGGATHTWSSSSTVKCTIRDFNAPSSEYLVANQVMGSVIKIVLLPLGTSVLKSDRLTIKGSTYKVVEPIPDISYSIFTRVVVVLTTLGV